MLRRFDIKSCEAVFHLLFTIVVLLANVTIVRMNKKYRTLLPGNLSRALDRFRLGIVHRGRFGAPFGLNGPFVRVRHDVLIGYCLR